MTITRLRIRILPTWAAFVVLTFPVAAQELSPRSYWPAPKGTRIAFLGYAYTSGDVLTDPSLPVVGVDSRLNNVTAGYLQTLSLWGRTSNLIIEVPYTWGTTEGTLAGQAVRGDVSGPGDIAVTLSANILGAPSMTGQEFQELRQRPHQILGASVKVVAPTGDYDKDKLLNVGTNRWAVKAELGYMIPIKPKWLLEIEAGVWVIGDNDEFLGLTREQEPIVSGELHLIRRLRPGFWAALDLNYYYGGRSTVGGEVREDLQRNSRIGLTLVYPFLRQNAIKVGYSAGVVTESGGDFQTILVSYSRLFR
jgi:hypothetical protein